MIPEEPNSLFDDEPDELMKDMKKTQQRLALLGFVFTVFFFFLVVGTLYFFLAAAGVVPPVDIIPWVPYV